MNLMKSDWAKLISVSTVHLAIFIGTMWRMSISIEHRFTVVEQRQDAANGAAARDREVQGEMLRQIREDMRDVRTRNGGRVP